MEVGRAVRHSLPSKAIAFLLSVPCSVFAFSLNAYFFVQFLLHSTPLSLSTLEHEGFQTLRLLHVTSQSASLKRLSTSTSRCSS